MILIGAHALRAIAATNALDHRTSPKSAGMAQSRQYRHHAARRASSHVLQ
jgi:hypothetical protein